MRRQLACAVVTATMVAAACTPSPPAQAGSGKATAGAPTPREVVSRDIDAPGFPDCSNWRYDAPKPDVLPVDYDAEEADFRVTSLRSDSGRASQHQLCGQKGPALDLAWGMSQGREDVVIAVLDSGIKWRDDDMVDLGDAAYLNRGELPLPSGSSVYDANGDGRFSISDYVGDPRVTDRNGTDSIDPEDLILDPAFSDGVDDDANGYVDDISGWDFLFGDNNPMDDVDYGHGTGEARDSTAVDGNGGAVGTCPQCRFLPVRVGDSFIADGTRFAAGVLFAVDSEADVVQEALGALNNPSVAQRAIDAAYSRGVPIVASMADEASQHGNLPALLEHTIPVNSITNRYEALGGVAEAVGVEGDYLALNGCTNFGGITWVTVPSNSCSSEATGLSAGMVGLIESHGRDAGLAPHPDLAGAGPGDNVLSANEVAQLLRSTADDVNFSTPAQGGRANEDAAENFWRYPTTPGWDAVTGFGRVNIFEALRAVDAGEIPPEADITSPEIYDVLGASGTLAVRGTVAARRSASFTYRVQWAPGLQTPPHPGADQWQTVGSGSGSGSTSGVLGSLSLSTIADALPNGGRGGSGTTEGPEQDRFAVRLRVVVTDAEGRNGVAQRQVFVHDDPDMITNERVAGAGATSPVFAAVDDTPGDELVLATDDGTVHVFGPGGDDIAGWPQTTPLTTWWPTWSETAAADGIEPPRSSVGIGAPIVVDLDGDDRVEIAVTDAGGHVNVWNREGEKVATMSVDPRFSQAEFTDGRNNLKRGFLSAPSAGDLDGDGDLEIVAAALDRHVYAWHHDGAPVDGFPVLVVDPGRVRAVDPVHHQVTFAAGATRGGELIVAPAIGDITGDGVPEIVVGAQEGYDEQVAVFPAIGLPGVSGNTRVYAISADGTSSTKGIDRSSEHPDDHAYVRGWPVPIALLLTEVLPLVGSGVNTQAAIGDMDGDGVGEVVVTSSGGPVYVLDGDGRSTLGRGFGVQLALDWLGTPRGARSDSPDGGLMVSAFGGPALGEIGGTPGLDVATTTVGLAQLADQLFAGDQRGDTQLTAWDGTTRAPLRGFPQRTSDLAFFVTPAIADVSGDGRAEVIAGNGVSLLDAIDADGDDAPGYPKLTGGWLVGTPGLGDIDGDGVAEMAVVRRDGVLMVFRTKGQLSDASWPRFGHDGRNSGTVPA